MQEEMIDEILDLLSLWRAARIQDIKEELQWKVMYLSSIDDDFNMEIEDEEALRIGELKDDIQRLDHRGDEQAIEG